MKPLLILPPAPARWPSLAALLHELPAAWLGDVELRFKSRLPGASDAFAVIEQGGQFLAHACIARKADIGVLGYPYTRPDHRGHGYARSLSETLLTWFEMSGGRWLYTFVQAADATSDFAALGFATLHSGLIDGREALVLLRRSPRAAAATTPLDDETALSSSDAPVRELNRSDWPLIVSLLAHRAGADPRVGVADSALAAEGAALDWIHQAERGTCRLLGAFHGARLIALGTFAADAVGERTYAMLLPHDHPVPALRAALEQAAAAKGYSHVSFPLEALHALPA